MKTTMNPISIMQETTKEALTRVICECGARMKEIEYLHNGHKELVCRHCKATKAA